VTYKQASKQPDIRNSRVPRLKIIGTENSLVKKSGMSKVALQLTFRFITVFITKHIYRIILKKLIQNKKNDHFITFRKPIKEEWANTNTKSPGTDLLDLSAYGTSIPKIGFGSW